MTRQIVRRGGQLCAAFVLTALLTMSSGCALISYGLYVVTGGEKEVEVDAEYYGLDDQSVAVIVHADDRTLYEHADAPLRIARALSAQISDAIPTARLVDPNKVAKFQKDNPYWVPYGDLMERFDADRLIVIDIDQYTTHDPQNTHYWRGVLSAGVSVTERDAADSEQFAYVNSLNIQYPQQPTPLLDSDEPTIEHGMVSRFAARVAALFHDHTEMR
jgi:hypothetical protein